MSTCARCGKSFECGMTDRQDAEPCWCTTLPPLPPEAYATPGDMSAGSCLCPACLREKLLETGSASGVAPA